MSYELTMHRYRPEFVTINDILREFVQDKHIDNKKLNMFDNVIKWSHEDQINVLNTTHLSFKNQSVLFGAFRNIEISIKVMKDKLENAMRRHENPSTAELAIDLMPNLLKIGPIIDNFLTEKTVRNVNELSTSSRTLYKKAGDHGFSKDSDTQLEEAGITELEVTSFVNIFRENISSELGIEEEIEPEKEEPS